MDWFPFSLSENSLDLTPSVLTHPSVSTSLVGVDGNGLGGSITVAGRAHPVILILQDNDGRYRVSQKISVRNTHLTLNLIIIVVDQKRVYLSVDDVAVPAVARHHPGHSVRVRQHVCNSHLVEPGVPEGDNGSTTGTMASLVVVVVNEDDSVAVGHEAPSLSPVPAHSNAILLMRGALLEQPNIKVFNSETPKCTSSNQWSFMNNSVKHFVSRNTVRKQIR